MLVKLRSACGWFDGIFSETFRFPMMNVSKNNILRFSMAVKNGNFQMKSCDNFLIFDQKIYIVGTR